MWIFSILLLWVINLEKDRLWKLCAHVPVWLIVVMTVFAYGFAQILNTPVVTVYRFGIYGFCFFAGYFIFSHDEVIQRLEKWWYLWDIIIQTIVEFVFAVFLKTQDNLWNLTILRDWDGMTKYLL